MFPVNQKETSHLYKSIADPVTQNLVSGGFGGAMMRFMDILTDAAEPISPARPAAPFDVAFHAGILESRFFQHDFIARIVAGEAVPPAPVVSSALALNGEAAEQVRASIAEPVCRNLVTAALNQVRAEAMTQELPSATSRGRVRMPRRPRPEAQGLASRMCSTGLMQAPRM